MRKQDKAIVWPVYFDQAKTRKEGRRVPKSFAVQSPRIVEITAAVAALGLKHEVVAEAGYPKMPWAKTGMIMVEKNGPKEQTIRKIAKQLLKVRSESLKQK
jgi:signal recognition particle subunit SRP19